MRYFRIILLLATFLNGFRVSAQTKTPDPGDQVVTTVISPFQPEITSNAKKIGDAPVIRDTVIQVQDVHYSIHPKKYNTTYEVEPIKAAQMVGEPLDKLYNATLKAGFGNYLNAYGELWVNSGRSKESAWGVHARHFSSSSGISGVQGFSGFSDDDVNIFGKKFIGKHTLDAGMDYSHNNLHYYGSDLPAMTFSDKAILQQFNYVGANVGLLSHYTDSSKINHEIRLNYYYFQDYFKTSENNIRLSGNMSRFLHTEKIGLDFSADYYNDHTLKDTSNNTILKIHPYIAANGEKWLIRAGLGAWTEFSKASPFFSFLPDAEASYDIYKHIITPYVGLDGNVYRDSYRRLTLENPFVSPLVASGAQNTRDKYMLYGGLRGTLSSYTSYDAHVSYGKVENAAFFVNDTTDPQRNKFTVVYDNGSLLQAHGELAWQKGEKLRLFIQGDFVKYFLDNELQPWHTPTTRITLSANYNLKNKIVVKADLFAFNQQYARTYVRNTATPAVMEVKALELKPLVDVNLGMEYRYTKFLSAFVNFNNIAAMNYERWHNYPTQRFNALIGISYIF
jgi:hypothetical protein